MEDVLQELRQRLLLGRGDTPPRIADYSGRGPLLAWVRIIGARIAGELSQQQGRQVLSSRLKLAGVEVESLLGLVQSRLDFSLRQLMS